MQQTKYPLKSTRHAQAMNQSAIMIDGMKVVLEKKISLIPVALKAKKS